MDGLAFGIHKYLSIFIVMNPFALFEGVRHQIFVFPDGVLTELTLFVVQRFSKKHNLLCL